MGTTEIAFENRYSEDILRFAVEAAPSGMLMADQNGRIVLVNAEMEKLFGYDRNELIGQNIEILVPGRFRNQHPDHRSHYFASPSTRAMGHGRDLYGLHKSGAEFPVEIGLNPVVNETGTFVLASVVDITERKNQEQQILAALREKEILLAEIHHRVKNNLQIIDSLLGMQSDILHQPDLVSVLKESQNRVKSMSLIHQTLYESLDYSQVNMNHVITSLVDNLCLSYALDMGRIKVRVDIDNVFLPIDISIPLGLIINEICSNAMKYAFPEPRKGCLEIKLEKIDEDSLRLKITDDGIGIPDDFNIEHASSLGLQLIQLLSEQVLGELKIRRSNPTCFEIILPIPVLPASL